MKTLIVWAGAFVLGMFGGVLGQRFTSRSSLPAQQTLPTTTANRFELVDPSGRVVSVWQTDPSGRPYIAFGDANWEGRIIVGPIDGADTIPFSPDKNAPWGVQVTAPGGDATATLGTWAPLVASQPSGFVSIHSATQTWRQDASGLRYGR